MVVTISIKKHDGPCILPGNMSSECPGYEPLCNRRGMQYCTQYLDKFLQESDGDKLAKGSRYYRERLGHTASSVSSAVLESIHKSSLADLLTGNAVRKADIEKSVNAGIVSLYGGKVLVPEYAVEDSGLIMREILGVRNANLELFNDVLSQVLGGKISPAAALEENSGLILPMVNGRTSDIMGLLKHIKYRGRGSGDRNSEMTKLLEQIKRLGRDI